MSYPKFKYRKADNEEGFESIIVNSKAIEDSLGDEAVDSPALLGIETHPMAPPKKEAHWVAPEPLAVKKKGK